MVTDPWRDMQEAEYFKECSYGSISKRGTELTTNETYGARH